VELSSVRSGARVRVEENLGWGRRYRTLEILELGDRQFPLAFLSPFFCSALAAAASAVVHLGGV
jgi:hypothetical protein